ncbi:hypothetical protein [Mucilaginibacter sp. PAMB04168]|uniref:hypothetical protein n=1 Tax=Mucilaginibacter sp. PAMB04168 TaxID=3138567 RepID=UPI0031F609A4
MKLLQRFFTLITISLLLALLPGLAFSQTQQPLNGIIFNNKTMNRAAQVSVTNLRHHSIVFSSDIGTFSIAAALGDTLLFTKAGFTSQKLVTGIQRDMMVYMVPALKLESVIVKGKTRKQEQQEVMDTYRSKGIYYNGKPPALSFLSSPLTGVYELFGKEPGRARHFAAQMKRENEQTEVNKRYTFDLVKRITQLPDEDVKPFMLAYNPPYPEILKWNDYELIQFINTSFAGYKQAKRLPKLNSLTEKEKPVNQ